MVAPGELLIRKSAFSTVASFVSARASQYPDRIAVEDGERSVTYSEFQDRICRLANALKAKGIGRGSCLAILSENRLEYLEVVMAAARLGAIVACQNWRLTPAELGHCLDLVEPGVVFVSPRHAAKLETLGSGDPILLGEAYEQLLLASDPNAPEEAAEPEDPLLILYTSGTTGLPKGAVISHRAQVVRNLVVRTEFGVAPEDTFVAWSPLYHMGAADCSIGTLMSGGKVVIVDGFDQSRLIEIVSKEQLGWLLVMPGMVGAFADELDKRNVAVAGVKVCGVMADLVPAADIARITSLLNAPYANTFGATETGCPPCSSSLIPVGVVPEALPKKQSPFCEVRLVNEKDENVPDGSPGELCMRGPTLFSGYWKAEEVNQQDFRGGWFHMGDVFIRNPDGTLDFVDRVKYLIKSGGENIYPAEIERVLLQDQRIADAAVVRRPDEKWGEVPVAFIARNDQRLTETAVSELCRAHLAGYKQPKEIRFIALESFPRSASGKIQRHELEKLI